MSHEPSSELNAAGERVDLLGMPLLATDESGLLEHIFAALSAGRGGWLITANLDFMRRYHTDADSRALYQKADLCVADGMPLVWAASLQGDHLPERIAGSALVFSLVQRASKEGRTVFLLGGEPGAAEGAAEVFAKRHPGLAIGHAAPMFASPPTSQQVEETLVLLRGHGDKPPDLLLVGLGSPKQEQLIERLRAHLPGTWMVGVGVSFSFVAGNKSRAPLWMQRAGLEWVHRMVQEPGRLVERYLVHDLPFAAVLFSRALLKRARRGAHSSS